MSDPLAFQQSFGAALAGTPNDWAVDHAVSRALAIHRNTSFRAAAEALYDNFPVVRQLVGEEAFAACAFRYVEDFPPVDPRLCLFGDGFERFVASYEPFTDIAYLADMARLERLTIEALFAADALLFTGAAFDMARPLYLHPATRVARFDSPVAALWEAHQPDANAGALDELDWHGCQMLVTRPQDVLVAQIDEPTAAFIDACQDERPLAEAAAAAASAGGDVSAVFALLISCAAFQTQSD